MSRVGLNPIKIEEGVQVLVEGKQVKATGSKGELSLELPWALNVEVKDGEVLVKRDNDEIKNKSLHGTYRMLIANMIKGVKEGFVRNLELVGVGYRARLEGSTLVMSLGLTHPVKFDAPEGITIEVPEETKVIISGIDKQKVGEFAAKVRSSRKPEPYKGKGIRYEGEYVKRKSAKSAITAKK